MGPRSSHLGATVHRQTDSCTKDARVTLLYPVLGSDLL